MLRIIFLCCSSRETLLSESIKKEQYDFHLSSTIVINKLFTLKHTYTPRKVNSENIPPRAHKTHIIFNDIAQI